MTAAFGITAAYAAPKVTEGQAKPTALRHAGLTPEQAQFKTIKYDGGEGDGRGGCKPLFYSGDEEFKYEIDAQSGGIKRRPRDLELNAELYGGPLETEGERQAIETALAGIRGALQREGRRITNSR